MFGVVRTRVNITVWTRMKRFSMRVKRARTSASERARERERNKDNSTSKCISNSLKVVSMEEAGEDDQGREDLQMR